MCRLHRHHVSLASACARCPADERSPEDPARNACSVWPVPVGPGALIAPPVPPHQASPPLRVPPRPPSSRRDCRRRVLGVAGPCRAGRVDRPAGAATPGERSDACLPSPTANRSLRRPARLARRPRPGQVQPIPGRLTRSRNGAYRAVGRSGSGTRSRRSRPAARECLRRREPQVRAPPPDSKGGVSAPNRRHGRTGPKSFSDTCREVRVSRERTRRGSGGRAAVGPDAEGRAPFALRADGRNRVRDEIRRARRGGPVGLDHQEMPETTGIAVGMGGALRVGAVPVAGGARRRKRGDHEERRRERRRALQPRHRSPIDHVRAAPSRVRRAVSEGWGQLQSAIAAVRPAPGGPTTSDTGRSIGSFERDCRRASCARGATPAGRSGASSAIVAVRPAPGGRGQVHLDETPVEHAPS